MNSIPENKFKACSQMTIFINQRLIFNRKQFARAIISSVV